MDPRRLRRYEEKLRHAQERLGEALSWLDDAAEDTRSRLAVYKAFQEACEAMTDLAAMVVVDSGITAADDYLNLDRACKAGLPIEGQLGDLKEATGLRNRLVHEYNGLDDPTALEAIGELGPAVQRFLEEVDAWLTSRR